MTVVLEDQMETAVYEHRASGLGSLRIWLSPHKVALIYADGSLVRCGDIGEGNYRYRVFDGVLIGRCA